MECKHGTHEPCDLCTEEDAEHEREMAIQARIDAAVAAERERWESAIGAEMPGDFKAWQESSTERPQTAAWCIANLRAREEAAWGHVAETADRAYALRAALTELRDRIKAHPAYADQTEEEELETGGDTAEFSYLARVADAALRA